MAECKQAVLVEKETAHRDCLTGCYDRMTIRHLVDLCFLKSDVRQSHAMFVIDVDNFKNYNDKYGHANGDLCLKHCARIMKKCFPEDSILGRYGGDEFVVCLKGATQEETYAYMQEFQSWLTPLTLSTGEVAELSVSAGGAAYPDQGEDFVSLCRSADAALYEVKQNGKGDFRVKG